MSLADSPPKVSSFQRLEDFPSYISCIKCFGKPIIPPLLTKGEKDEISAFRKEAIKKEVDVLNMKKHLSLSEKVRDVYYKVQEHPASYDDDSIPNFQLSLPGKSALSLNSMNAYLSSSNVTSFSDEMHVSMSKLPSSGICSTVHRGVIVCPNEINAGKKYDDLLNIPPKCPFNPSDQNIYSHQFLNSECHLCQVDCHQDFLLPSSDHYDNMSNEHLCSVSEDEQGGSVMEDTDFESLPTVISAKKRNMQDTDDESNVTCLTQSTDLEKYMDCSIEFSSPDDLVSIANSQMSSQNTMSCRSDDASSETLVNTESELTPCASAMAELNGYSDDAQTGIAEPLSNVSSTETAPSNLHDRAYSVDSYMEIIKTCSQISRALPMKKSQSEPSHSNAVKKNAAVRNLFPSKDTATTLIENFEDKTESKSENQEDGVRKAENSVLSSTEVAEHNVRSISESKSEESSLHKKTHVRTNSYTLDYPSSALIMAHANCDCKSDNAENVSPYSCTSEKKNKVPLNLAFQKEKVNIVLPPTPDRDKLFPILNTTCCSSIDSINIQNSESKLSKVSLNSTDSYFLDTSLSPIVDNCKELDISTKDDQIEPITISNENINFEIESNVDSISTESVNSHQHNCNPKSIEIQMEKISSESTDRNFYNEMKTIPPETSDEELEISDQVTKTPSIAEKDVRNDNIQVFLNQIFKDIQESQKMRVNQLLEEQNRQWLQLQEEFKEQERLLCAKLNLVNIPSVSDHDFSIIPSQHFSDSSSVKGAKEKMPTKQNIRPNVNASSISDIANKECLTGSEIGCENYFDESHISELSSNSNNQELKASGTLLQKSNEVVSEPIAYSDLKLLPSNISLNKSGDMELNNCGESASAVKDTEEIFSDSQKVASSSNCQMLVVNANNYPHGNTSSTLDHQCDDMQSSSSTKSPMSGDCESEMFTSNTSISRTNDVPSSLSLSQKSAVFPSSIENMHDKSDYKNSNILLQSSYDLPHLIKYFPLPVSSVTSDEATSNFQRSVLSQNFEMHQRSCELQQFVGDREICTLSPISPCICFAVHQQEFNADCPHCHACMNCDTNCLKHVNYPQTNFTDLNGYSDCEDRGKYHNLEENCDPVCSEFSPENQGQDVNTKSVKSDSFHAHLLETESYDAKECLLKGNNYNKKMHLLQNVSNVNMKKDTAMNICKTNTDLLIRARALKSVSNEKIYPSGSSNNFSKSHELRLKNSISSRSPKKGEKNFGMYQKFKKIPVEVPSLCKANTLKKIGSPTLTNLKRRQSRDILEFINDPSIQKKLEKLPALVKGYLTRRLFQTERVQDLVKTLKDTVLIIGKLSEELTSKGNPVSEQDVDFHRQLIVQLMATFRNVYDIFCTYSVKEQMEIISESRSYQLKKKASEESQVSSAVSVVSERSNSSIPPKKSKLSAATVKSLERKRRSAIDSRTYTIEDFKGCRPRICSKSRVTSPSRIYKSAMDSNFKSKTRGLKSQHWK